MEMETKENKNLIRCTNCDSSFVYFVKKEGVWQCRKCGQTFKHDQNENENKGNED